MIILFSSFAYNYFQPKPIKSDHITYTNPIIEENRKPGGKNVFPPQLLKALRMSTAKIEDEGKSNNAKISSAQEATGNFPIPNNCGLGSDPYSNPIEGYSRYASVNIGSTEQFMIRDSVSNSYKLEVYRLGWYGGAGVSTALVSTNLSTQSGNNLNNEQYDPYTGLREAMWSVSYSLTIPSDGSWPSGLYIVALTDSTSTSQNPVIGYIPFVVRDDNRTTDILYNVPVATWEAYNKWGGQSLYFGSADLHSDTRAYKVSLNRPYLDNCGSSVALTFDSSVIQFLESQGYNVKYTTDMQMNNSNTLLNNVKVFLTDFHDEYWSYNMEQNLVNGLNTGKSFAFLSANNLYWQTRIENSPVTGDARVIVCYKYNNTPDNGPGSGSTADPYGIPGNPSYNPSRATTLWRDPNYANTPEDAIIGAGFTDYNPTLPQTYSVTNSNNWVYSGTGLQNNSQIPNLVGYEWDLACQSGCQGNITSISNSQVTDLNNNPSISNATIKNVGSNGSGPYVFDASSINWEWGLKQAFAQRNYISPYVQEITNNVLSRMIYGAPSTTYVSTVKNDNPVSYYRLSDWNTTTAKDQMGSNNGSYQNNPSLGQTGTITNDPDTAVQFNGSNQYVSVPYKSALNTSQFSIETWAKWTGAGVNTFRGVVSSRSWPLGWVIYAADHPSNANVWSFWINNGGSGGNENQLDSNVPIVQNQWYHLVATYDGYTARLYVNGVDSADSSVINYFPNNNTDERIGQSTNGNFFFPGVIDDTSFYNYALSPAQVAKHFAAGLQGPTPPQPDNEYCAVQGYGGNCLPQGVCTNGGGSPVSLVPACTSTGYSSGTVCCIFPTPTPTPTPVPSCTGTGGACVPNAICSAANNCNMSHANACLQLDCASGNRCCY